VADAERGGCGVRENRGGTYYTLVHSLACSVHLDPIEKKPFFHVLPGAQALSYATAGCNVECKFCQNWEISQFRPEQVRSQYLPPETLVEVARRNGVPLLSATYSEPVVFWEYVRDTAAAGRRLGVRSTVVSNGYAQEQALKDVLPLIAAMKVDLKAFTERFYRELVRGELKPVLKALEVIKASGTWLEIVVLLVPGQNDSEGEVRDLSRWVKANLGAEVPVHFTRFHPTYRLTNLPPTPVPTLERAWQVAKAEGLAFPYLGNVPGHPGENTTCPGCGKQLIRRVGFQVLDNVLASGKCPQCKRAIPGVWS
jgi:pyruvate formate lyase activating enzyme